MLQSTTPPLQLYCCNPSLAIMQPLNACEKCDVLGSKSPEKLYNSDRDSAASYLEQKNCTLIMICCHWPKTEGCVQTSVVFKVSLDHCSQVVAKISWSQRTPSYRYIIIFSLIGEYEWEQTKIQFLFQIHIFIWWTYIYVFKEHFHFAKIFINTCF